LSVTGAAYSSGKVELTLSPSATANHTVTIEYTKSGTSGQQIGTVGVAATVVSDTSARSVQNNVKPVVVSKKTSSAQSIVLLYNSNVQASDSSSLFTLKVDSVIKDITGVSFDRNEVTIQTSATMTAASVVTIQYTAGTTANSIGSLHGAKAESIAANSPVTNRIAPVRVSLEATGAQTIALTYNADIQASAISDGISQFSINIGSISSVQISSKVVTITMSSNSFDATDTIPLSYPADLEEQNRFLGTEHGGVAPTFEPQ
jgi:hypothetical protein